MCSSSPAPVTQSPASAPPPPALPAQQQQIGGRRRRQNRRDYGNPNGPDTRRDGRADRSSNSQFAPGGSGLKM